MFIGSHIVDRLLAHGHSVRVFDRQAEKFRGPLRGVDYRFGDFADRMALVEALTGVEAVYHLVSTTLPGTADLDLKTDIQDNLIGAINLFESMHGLGVHRILFLSSGGTVYGIPEMVPIPETHPLLIATHRVSRPRPPGFAHGGEPPAEGNVLICCAQPEMEIELDL